MHPLSQNQGNKEERKAGVEQHNNCIVAPVALENCCVCEVHKQIFVN
jgi:hypothetical protein